MAHACGDGSVEWKREGVCALCRNWDLLQPERLQHHARAQVKARKINERKVRVYTIERRCYGSRTSQVR